MNWFMLSKLYTIYSSIVDLLVNRNILNIEERAIESLGK